MSGIETVISGTCLRPAESSTPDLEPYTPDYVPSTPDSEPQTPDPEPDSEYLRSLEDAEPSDMSGPN